LTNKILPIIFLSFLRPILQKAKSGVKRLKNSLINLGVKYLKNYLINSERTLKAEKLSAKLAES